MGNLIRQHSNLSLTERLKLKKNQPALLLDISGSMDIEVEPGLRRIDALRNVVNSLEGSFICLAFNQTVQPCLKDSIPQPGGGTALSPALKEIKARNLRQAIIVTDGEVNEYDQEFTLKESEGLTLKIIYVGSSEKPKFLEKLAKQTGGFCDVEDLKQQKELTTKIQGLLGPVETERKIEL